MYPIHIFQETNHIFQKTLFADHTNLRLFLIIGLYSYNIKSNITSQVSIYLSYSLFIYNLQNHYLINSLYTFNAAAIVSDIV